MSQPGGGSGPAGTGGSGSGPAGGKRGWVRSSRWGGVRSVSRFGGDGSGPAGGGVSILRPLAEKSGIPLAFTQEVFLVKTIKNG